MLAATQSLVKRHCGADPSPLSGANYYRLQTTSTNSIVNYSNVIAVTNSDIKISPNPAKNILQIQGLPSNQKIKVTVVDFAGNTKLQTIANGNTYNLNKQYQICKDKKKVAVSQQPF